MYFPGFYDETRYNYFHGRAIIIIPIPEFFKHLLYSFKSFLVNIILELEFFKKWSLTLENFNKIKTVNRI